MFEASLIKDMKLTAQQEELLNITWQMLEAIHTGDYETYGLFTSEELSCFEDVCAYRIDGLEFHLSLISQMARNPANRPERFDILSPRIQLYGETGIVTYTRLMTYSDNGKPKWQTYNESRVFVRESGEWKMVHFHRTPT